MAILAYLRSRPSSTPGDCDRTGDLASDLRVFVG